VVSAASSTRYIALAGRLLLLSASMILARPALADSINPSLLNFLQSLYLYVRCDAPACSHIRLPTISPSMTYRIVTNGTVDDIRRAESLEAYISSFVDGYAGGRVHLSRSDNVEADVTFDIVDVAKYSPPTNTLAPACQNKLRIVDDAIIGGYFRLAHSSDIGDASSDAGLPADLLFNNCAVAALDTLFDYPELRLIPSPTGLSFTISAYWESLWGLRGADDRGRRDYHKNWDALLARRSSVSEVYYRSICFDCDDIFCSGADRHGRNGVHSRLYGTGICDASLQ